MQHEEPPVFVGMRVDELPRPHVPSTTRSCEQCGAVIWVSKSQVRVAVTALRILCTHCFLVELEAEDQVFH